MAAYIDVEHGYVFDRQSDLPWTQTNRMTLRAPAIANRIFDTLAHAQAYIDDMSPKASAVPGLLLSIINDNVDSKNNGVYRVVSTKSGNVPGVLERVGGNITVEVHNITTDIEEYTTDGIYFITDATTGKKYVLMISVLNGVTTQTLWGADGYKTRILTEESGEEPIWSAWESTLYEVQSNKVSSLDNSNSHYPTTKLVGDELAKKIDTPSVRAVKFFAAHADFRNVGLNDIISTEVTSETTTEYLSALLDVFTNEQRQGGVVEVPFKSTEMALVFQCDLTIEKKIKFFLYDEGYVVTYDLSGETVTATLERIGAGSSIQIDDVLSLESENPVQNKIITAALNLKMNANGKDTDALKDLLKSWVFRSTGGDESVSDGDAKIAVYQGNVVNGVPFFATQMEAVGFNAFNPDNVLEGKRISPTTGEIEDSTGSKVAFVHVLQGVKGNGENNGYIVLPKSTATLGCVGFSTSIPENIGDSCSILTEDSETNSYFPTSDGFLWISIDNISDLCVHLAWSGYRNEDAEDYSVSHCTLPMTHDWGMGLAGAVFDEVNYLNHQKITRVDRAMLSELTWEEHQEAYQEGDEEHIRYSYTTEDLVGSIKGGTTNINYGTLASMCVVTVGDDGVVTVSTGTDQVDPEVAFAGYLYYELSEYIQESMEEALMISVSDFGTEEILGNGVAPHAISVFYLSNLGDFVRSLYLNKDSNSVDVEKVTFLGASSTLYATDKEVEVVSVKCYACNSPLLNGVPVVPGLRIMKDAIYSLSVTMMATNSIVILKTKGLS